MSDQAERAAHEKIRDFWAWHDFVLNDCFAVECSDIEAVSLLDRVKEEGVMLILVRASGRKEALASAFPDRYAPTQSSMKRT